MKDKRNKKKDKMVRFLFSGNWEVIIPLKNKDKILDFFGNDSNLSYEWYESFVLRKWDNLRNIFLTSPLGLALNDPTIDERSDDEWFNKISFQDEEENIKVDGHFEHFYGDDAIKFFSYLSPFAKDFSFSFIKRDEWTGHEVEMIMSNISGEFRVKNSKPRKTKK